jgi:hypothetical protein
VTTGQREDGVDPAGFEPASDKPAGMKGVLSLVAHPLSVTT